MRGPVPAPLAAGAVPGRSLHAEHQHVDTWHEAHERTEHRVCGTSARLTKKTRVGHFCPPTLCVGEKAIAVPLRDV